MSRRRHGNGRRGEPPSGIPRAPATRTGIPLSIRTPVTPTGIPRNASRGRQPRRYRVESAREPARHLQWLPPPAGIWLHSPTDIVPRPPRRYCYCGPALGIIVARTPPIRPTPSTTRPTPCV